MGDLTGLTGELSPTNTLDLAILAYEEGDLFRAQRICEQIISARHDSFDALHLLAVIQAALGKNDLALENYDRALEVQPSHPGVLFNRGNALRRLERFEEALASYDRALAARPQYAQAFCNRATVLGQLKRFEEALASCDRALTLQPDLSEALSNRGNVLRELKRFDEALASYDRAVTMRPEDAEAFCNRGNVLLDLKRLDQALESFDCAISLRPNHADALSSRGNVLKEQKRIAEALASFDLARAIRPDHIEAHWNEALARLLIGDFEIGWQKYEWRWKKEFKALSPRNFAQPLWLGNEVIRGKTILLHSEQGYGDTIQFCRYAPLVAARGARVILEVEEPLHELVSSLAGVLHVISKGDSLPDFDFQCPLLSLPLAFGTRLETIPSMTPYLNPAPPTLNHWETRVPAKGPLRIGLAWSGGATLKDDANRSIPLRSLLSLLDTGATFVSLQKDVRSSDAAVLRERDDVIHFGDELVDFADTAALISQLDLIISVDTSVAHLAGALGKPVWVLLPFVPDWRWLLDRPDSPWYPTMRLFRQSETRKWDDVVERVHNALHFDVVIR